MARLQEFYQRGVQQTGPEVLLQVYCRALREWAEDPTTDLYQAERLLDDLYHTSELEAHEDDADARLA